MLFVEAKTNLTKLVDDTVADTTAKKSAYARLTASVSRLAPEQLDELQKQADTVGLLLLVDEKIRSLWDYTEKVTCASFEEIDGVTASVNDIIEQLNVKNDEGEEMLEACSFLLGQEREDSRKQQMAQRYQRSKISGKLMLGGFGVGYAIVVAEKLKTMQDDCKAFTNPDEINYQVPMRWAAPDEKFVDRLVCHPVEYKEKSAVSVESNVSNLSNLIGEQKLMFFWRRSITARRSTTRRLGTVRSRGCPIT